MVSASDIKPAEKKSLIGTFILVFLFGPLGALYVSAPFAAIYLVVAIGVALVTGGFGVILVWLVYLLYAPEMVSRQNKAERERVRLAKLEIEEQANKLALEEKRHQELLDAVKQGKIKNISDIEF